MHQSMEQNSVIISYHGYLNYQITGDLIEKLEQMSGKMEVKKSTFRKIITLMIEMLENNYKYVNALNNHILETSPRKPYFRVKKEGSHFKLESGNPILKKDTNALRKKIEYINELSYDELQELYKNTMADGIYENKKGAGLGIMKMAKISRNNIRYSIIDNTSHTWYYTIEVVIPENHNA
ncbi:MAG: SiaB family protein kinase [Bacteroidales bacterium]